MTVESSCAVSWNDPANLSTHRSIHEIVRRHTIAFKANRSSSLSLIFCSECSTLSSSDAVSYTRPQDLVDYESIARQSHLTVADVRRTGICHDQTSFFEPTARPLPEPFVGDHIRVLITALRRPTSNSWYIVRIRLKVSAVDGIEQSCDQRFG